MKNSHIRLLLALGSVSFYGVPLACATSDTWSGATDSIWANSPNWLGGNVPGTGNTATFNSLGNGNTTIDLGTGVTLGSLLFDTSSAAAYTIGAGGVGAQTLTISTAGAAITMNSTVTSNELLNANLALGTNAITINNSSTNGVLAIAGNITSSGNITKTGAGVLSLSGANTLTGNLVDTAGFLNVTAGAANFAGAFSNLGSTANTTAVVNVSPGAAFGWTGNNGGNFAGAASASGVLYNSGTFSVTGSLANNSGAYLGNAAGSYGYLRNNAGATATVNGRLWIAQSGNAIGSAGVLDITGGNVTVNGTNIDFDKALLINGDGNAHATSTSYAGVNVVNGTLSVAKSGAQVNLNGTPTINVQNTYTSFNISGSGKFTAGAAGTNSGLGLGVSNNATNIATLSVSNGGTLETAYMFSNNALGSNVLSFDNGTIRSLFNNAQGIIQGTNIKAYIFAGGATFDTNGFATIDATPLLAPTANGVTSIALGGTATGYVGAPVVKISGGGGTGAAAVANFDPTTGTVTGITITSPGSGYTSAPTVTLMGGNGGATGVTAGAATATAGISAVTGGGLTKTGNGTLTLSANNTYSGPTNVNAGTLTVNAINGGTGTVTVASGAILNGAGKIEGPVVVSGSLSGTLTLDGDVTVSSGAPAGATAFNGNVVADGSIASAVSVQSGKTLSGAGSVVGITVNDGGFVAPGHSNPGVLNDSNGLSFSGPNATLSISVAKTAPFGTQPSAGADYSVLNVIGGTTALNNATLTLSGSGTNLSPNDLFFIVLSGGNAVSGTFNGLADQSQFTALGQTFEISYTASLAGNSFIGGGNDVALEVIAVPEPGTWAMLLGGFGMLTGWQRSRRRKA